MMYEAIRNFAKQFAFEPVVENADKLPTAEGFVVAGMGCAHLAEPDNFLEVVRFAMSRDGQEYIRDRQEENFPLPKTWDTAPAIVDFLAKVAGE